MLAANRVLASCLLLALAAPLSVRAQTPESRIELRPHGGAFLPEEASALDAAALVGVQVTYRLTPMVSVGFNVGGVRTLTRENFFRPAQLDFGTRYELFDVRQEVSSLHYSGEVGLSFGTGTLRPFLVGGAGGYTLFLTGESNQRVVRLSGTQITGGAGINYRVNERSGVSIEIRDYLLLSYDQDALNPVQPRSRDAIFFERWPSTPEAKDQVNAFLISIGFTYHP